jgi:hypothetical protein
MTWAGMTTPDSSSLHVVCGTPTRVEAKAVPPAPKVSWRISRRRKPILCYSSLALLIIEPPSPLRPDQTHEEFTIEIRR